MLMKLTSGLLLGLLALPILARADTISDVAGKLDTDTVIPLASGVDLELAGNLLQAQALASYASPLSLNLSVEAVLKAISLYTFPGGPALITSETDEPIVWAQSRIAIDPQATVSLNPPSLDFGSQPVTTPEPEAWVLLLIGVAAFVIWWIFAHSSSVSFSEA